MLSGSRALAAAQIQPERRSLLLKSAITDLDHARWWRPADAQIYRQLAQARQLQGQRLATIAALEQAYRLQPESLLIQQELALAYQAVGRHTQARDLWLHSGVTAEQMAGVGDQHLTRRDYAEATHWYDQALRHGLVLRADLAFRRAVAATLAGSPEAVVLWATASEFDPTLAIYSLERAVTIPGGTLRWMTPQPEWGITYGTPLSFSAPDANMGVFWWSGEAMAIIDAPQAGEYEIQLHLRHSDPPPVEMAVGVNGQQLQQIVLERGDNSWETVTSRVIFDKGINLLTIGYLNDAFVDGRDRNGIVAWIQVACSQHSHYTQDTKC